LIEVNSAVWRETLAQFRTCGRGQNECVVYWVGPAGGQLADEAVHPEHLGRSGYYEVDPKWFHRFWVDLDHRGRSVFAQVHTHGGRAFHSDIDDEGAIVQVPGFVSIVLPGFAMNNAVIDATYVARLDEHGAFVRSTLEAEIRFVS
jgi:proteasome lid subunit RPN8/RPN11